MKKYRSIQQERFYIVNDNWTNIVSGMNLEEIYKARPDLRKEDLKFVGNVKPAVLTQYKEVTEEESDPFTGL